MKTKIKFLLTAMVIILAFGAMSCSNNSKKPSETHDHQHETAQYTCSMHPEVVMDEPGNCPKCGMELIVKKTDEPKEQSNAEDIKKVKFKVDGSCDMCESRIEIALNNSDGVYIANWDINTKMVEVSFVESKTNMHDIQLAVALAGYDTELHKASNEAYSKLPDCCRYVRTL